MKEVSINAMETAGNFQGLIYSIKCTFNFQKHNWTFSFFFFNSHLNNRKDQWRTLASEAEFPSEKK